MQQSKRMHSVQTSAIQAASNVKKSVKGEEIHCKQIVPFDSCSDLIIQSNQTGLPCEQLLAEFRRSDLPMFACRSHFKRNNNAVIKETFNFCWYNLFISSLGSGAAARSSLENAISRRKMGLLQQPSHCNMRKFSQDKVCVL